MVTEGNLRDTKIPLNSWSGEIPALGFGTLIADPVETKKATEILGNQLGGASW